MNDAFVNACGITREELIGEPLSNIHTPLQHDDHLEELRQACLRKRAYDVKGTLTTRKGAARQVWWHISPVYQGEDPGHVVCRVSIDTETSEIIGALRASEKRYRDLFEHGHVGKAIVGLDGRFININQSFCDLVGYDKDDLKGRHCSIVLRERDRPAVADRLQAIAERNMAGYQSERQYVRKDGSTVTAIVDVSPERDGSGNVRAVVIQAQDISNLKATEAGLRESEARLRDFAEIAADWFWETDENLVITYVSHVHRQITGIPDEQIIGRTREELFRENIYRAVNPAVHLRTLNNYWDTMVEYSVRREDGREVVVHDRASPFFDSEGNFRGYRGVGRDITEQRRLTEHIAYQATHDPLTGAVNRREFERQLEEALEDARRRSDRHVLCFMDLNKFKPLNDTLGHAAGDYLLKSIVEMMQDHMSPDDLLGRLGGDEFGILFRDTDPEDAKRIANDINRSIRDHDFEWQNRRFSVAVSMGLAPIDAHTDSTSELLARADAACYRAKEESIEGVWLSDEDEAERLRTYTGILRSLASGPVDLSGNFQLVGQPICALDRRDRAPAWYEVLLRVVGRDGQFYRPYEFIHLAEQHGRMPMIDQWVLETAVAQHASLVERVPDAVLSMNLASNSLSNERLQEVLDGLLDDSPVRPGNICFEISEPSTMTDIRPTVSLVEALLDRGYRVALDDFGSGPSYFEWLKSLPVHYLKLYGDLVRELRGDGPDIAIIEFLDGLSRRLNLTLVAVQVESPRTADVLKEIGVAFGQGEALATTRPLSELTADMAGSAPAAREQVTGHG